MLRYALRRILWSVPTLIATSLVLFLVTTLAADASEPRTDAASREAPGDSLERATRARFADLPRFLNPDPQDVRSRARQALSHIAAGEAQRGLAAAELCRLGGAGLPYVLPMLETLPPEARGEVAVGLAPLGQRMGVAGTEDLARPDTAVLFWTHLWEERALDYTRAAVDRAIGRLVEHGSDLRERDLAVMDTFALPEIIGAMSTKSDTVALERLTRLARHATARGRVIAAGAAPDDVRRSIADWQEWWFVQGTDFVARSGVERALSFVTETRYGKWLERARTGELGVSTIDGEPIAGKLRLRAPTTIVVCGLAMLVSFLLAVPLGALAAWWQGRPFDTVSSAVLFLFYAVPTFAVAESLRRVSDHPGMGARGALAVLALSAGSVATLSRWQRSAMLELVRQDFVRTARAKGVAEWRVAVVHVLRNALQPMVTLAGLHLPAVLGGAFVVEAIFGLPGVGSETLRAIEAHDSPWLMAVLLVAACAATLGLVASDVASAMLDPRVRELLTGREGGSAT